MSYPQTNHKPTLNPPAPKVPRRGHTQLCHTRSFTYNFVAQNVSHKTLSHTHNLSHISTTHNFVTHNLSHTTLSHTVFRVQFATHNLSHKTLLQELSHITLSRRIFHTHTSFTHNDNFVTHTTLSQHFWHLATSTLVLRGRGGTYSTGLGLVARLVAVSRP